MILSCQNISKSFGTDVILKNISFHVEDYEKVAIVGINGAGKSTLLKIITGELAADEGQAVLAKGKTLGYLAQHQEISDDKTIYDTVLESKKDIIHMEEQIRQMELEMDQHSGDDLNDFLSSYHKLCDQFEHLNGYAYRSEVSGVLKGLGFEEADFEKLTCELSGGQKTRVALARLLVTKPDIIMLDEPTNHLDIESITWLETFLQNYSGAVVIVAHDRYFLDRIVTKVVEISLHQSMVFHGNYSEYAVQKAQVRESQLKQYMNQQRDIKHQQEVIEKLKSFNREKSIKRAESREKMLAKVDVLDKPIEENTEMNLTLEPEIVSGNDVLAVEHLCKSYDTQKLFEDISFEIKRGERIALIGHNGTGKTTILKILNEMVEADAGTVKFGTNVHVGYYDQEHQVLDMDKTLFEEIADTYPDLTQTKIRSVLAAFLFSDDDVFKYIRDLSGGERGRVSLAKLMLSEANFLILDEPTNHLDITSKEILESALNKYTGTVLYVSHDRYFINKTATTILNLTGQTLIKYVGNYDYYLEKKDILENVYLKSKDDSSEASTKEPSLGKLDWKQQKEEQAKQRKRENAIKKLEERIEILETEAAEIDQQFLDPANMSNSAKLGELHARKTAIEEELEELFEQWEELDN